MVWWDNEQPGTSCRVILFQVDIAGHSLWVEKSENDLTPARARAEFAELLGTKLRLLGFDRLYWLGDGGVFAKKYNQASDADMVCRVAEETFEWFREWKRPEWDLKIRATAAYIHNAFIDRDPGNWCSPRMNAFLKYEREFRLSDASSCHASMFLAGIQYCS